MLHAIDTTSTCKCDATMGYSLTQRIYANIRPPEACAGILWFWTCGQWRLIHAIEVLVRFSGSSSGYMRPTNRRRPARGPRAIEAKFGVRLRVLEMSRDAKHAAKPSARSATRLGDLDGPMIVEALWLMHDVGRAEMRRPAVRRIRARLEVSTSFGDLMQTPDRRRHARGLWASAAMAQCCRRQKRQGARSRDRATNRGCKIRLNE
ncbi:hypothetical protein EV714DRAFT_278063 [Schizophyllum commune]